MPAKTQIRQKMSDRYHADVKCSKSPHPQKRADAGSHVRQRRRTAL